MLQTVAQGVFCVGVATQRPADVTIKACHACTVILDRLAASKQAVHLRSACLNMSSPCRKFEGNFLPEFATAFVANCFSPNQRFASTWLRSTSL